MKTFKCIESLEENSVEVFLEVSSILLKLVDNILTYPSNPKFRKLRLENKLVSTVIIPSIGAMECLFEIGFQEGEDALLLPAENTSLENLSVFRAEISKRRNKYLKENNRPTECGGNDRQSTPQPEAASQAPSQDSRINSNVENLFLRKLQVQSLQVLQYENENVKCKALSVIPLNDINERVETRMRQLQNQALKDSQPINEASLQETILFTELMAWFKNNFFHWVDSPLCLKCKCDTQFLEMSSDPEELKLSQRVEVYKCGRCNGRVLFPRLNDVLKLLDTRRGRCGEWANVFTALCRALQWDARFVVDETDHVWTEVFFKSEQRWVHCDPCECALDKPLLYEKGWGKQLSYIIAFSCEEVQDVTWRYSANHKALMSRRTHCTEQQLLHTLKDLNTVRQSRLSALRKKWIARRTLVELVQLMCPAVESVGDSEGRQSGSLQWRLARSETTLPPSHIWTPTTQEVEAKKMIIEYCTAKDEYRRGQEGERVKGWGSGAFTIKNMFLKEEKDWKTVYICRTESSKEGKIEWQFDFSSSGLKVDEIEVHCLSTTFQNGKVLWLLCSGDKCIQINNGRVKTCELRGSTEVKLSATVSGGVGSNAWQHAQLFRQPSDASDQALTVTLTLSHIP